MPKQKAGHRPKDNYLCQIFFPEHFFQKQQQKQRNMILVLINDVIFFDILITVYY